MMRRMDIARWVVGYAGKILMTKDPQCYASAYHEYIMVHPQ